MLFVASLGCECPIFITFERLDEGILQLVTGNPIVVFERNDDHDEIVVIACPATDAVGVVPLSEDPFVEDTFEGKSGSIEPCIRPKEYIVTFVDEELRIVISFSKRL